MCFSYNFLFPLPRVRPGGKCMSIHPTSHVLYDLPVRITFMVFKHTNDTMKKTVCHHYEKFLPHGKRLNMSLEYLISTGIKIPRVERFCLFIKKFLNTHFNCV